MKTTLPCTRALLFGASAGGVDALMHLLPALPASFPAAVLVVLHRQPQADGGLARLLQSRSVLPLDDAWDRQPIAAGQVLLAPPDYHLLVDPGPIASLSADEPVLYSRPAIDPLFESAAAVFGAGVIACVLTGASSDGAAGARAVRQAGGRVWVQSPAEAQSSVMPRAALDSAGADAVLTLQQLYERLLKSDPWKEELS